MSDLVEVETLKVPKLIPFRGKDLHEEMIGKLCPALRHLIIPRHALRVDAYSLNQFRPMACTFIRGCLGLRTVQGEGFLYEEGEGEPSRGIISTVHKYHSKTIEEIEFSDCVAVGSAHQQAILASCRQLKRFWIVPNGSSMCRYGLQFQHILENEWVCLELRELSLTLNRHIDFKATIEAMRQESSGKAVGREELAYDKLSDAEKIELALKASTWAAKRVCTQIDDYWLWRLWR